MNELISLKAFVLDWSGLPRETLQVYAGLLVHLSVATVFRRSLASVWPWLCVLGLASAHEWATIVADRLVDRSELAPSARDLVNTVLVPTLLLVLCRINGRLVATRGRPARRTGGLVALHRSPRVQAVRQPELVELQPDERGNWRQIASLGFARGEAKKHAKL